MTLQEALDHIKSTNGRIFAIKFTKRSDGSIRVMQCRLGVKSHVTGGGPAFDFASKGLLCVFDMAKGQYRSIGIEGIVELKVAGEWQKVEPISQGAKL